jgi:hypothetical protein
MAAKPKHPAGPPMTLGNMRQLTRGVATACVVAIISGCASDDILSPYAEPGRYDFLDCTSIAERITKASDREKQLALLMTRASEAADGAIVNAIAYQDEYRARANLRSLRKAAEVKKCQLPEPLPTEPRR